MLSRPEETSKEAITRALQGYGSIGPDDVFLFFVATHGAMAGPDLLNQENFLISSNKDSLSHAALRRDRLSQQELKRLIGDVPSTRKFILLDTCHPGALGTALARAADTRLLAEQTATTLLAPAVGTSILLASTS